MPNGKRYLMDATARQFFPATGDSVNDEPRAHGNAMLAQKGGGKLAADLLAQGYVELDGEAAATYARAMRAKPHETESTSPDAYFDKGNLDRAKAAHGEKMSDFYGRPYDVDPDFEGVPSSASTQVHEPGSSMRDGGSRESPWYTDEGTEFSVADDFWSPNPDRAP
jgi:hypothetical protein